MTTRLTLPLDSPDDAAQARAADPRFNIALEASAGTGKTRVLVKRYINLLHAGVDPSNILAITFTRKAAAEMRERIMGALRIAADKGEITPARWRDLRDRTADITISTIDAFCLSLLREFPLEADLDPAFSVADDAELPGLIDEALSGALRICRTVARSDDNVALVFSQLGEARVREALTTLLHRRIVAPDILSKYLGSTGAVDLDVASASRRAAGRLIGVCESMPGGLDGFLACGPLKPAFLLLAHGLRQLRASITGEAALDPGVVQAVFFRAREHFLTQTGTPRARSLYPKAAFAAETDWRLHQNLVVDHADAVRRVWMAARRDVNVLAVRGIWKMFHIAEAEYRQTLDAHATLDFSDLLLRALTLLRRMDDFSQSRYRLESRYHHVLVDEFQDTSRAQWELVSLLIQSWGEGAGLADTGPLQPSIFTVGDRKQSIYAFRDADVSVLREAARHLEGLRPDSDVRHTISRSFRAVPSLQVFINDVCHDIDKVPDRADAFEYADVDRFPVDAEMIPDTDEALGLVIGDTADMCAAITASEIARLLSTGATVKDRKTKAARAICAGDIAILFRTRVNHRKFEAALAKSSLRSYVYKGMGFYDADEIKDMLALVSYLADPVSDLCAAALMRSRFFGVSDEALRRLAPHLSATLMATTTPQTLSVLDPDDRHLLEEARQATSRWRGLVDRVPAAELVDLILSESAYAFELRGGRFDQARENLKKIRSFMRRTQNRGFGTFARMATHLSRLAVEDEANAVIDAVDAVNLMTVHAAKGLEFPVVFVVDLTSGGPRGHDPVRLTAEPSGKGGSVAVGDFQSEADDDQVNKDREETKRMLYVALSRARDRVYLATVLKDGRMRPAPGSLGEVLPPSLRSQFETATDGVEWRASSGHVHRFRRCVVDTCEDSLVSDTEDDRGEFQVPPLPEPRLDDFSTLVSTANAGGSQSRPVPSNMAGVGGLPAGRAPATEHDHSDRVVGTLVHRMMHLLGLDFSGGKPVVQQTALRILRSDEALAASVERTPVEVAEAAVEIYELICGQTDVRTLYENGAPLHEVPFTMRLDGVVVRGTIDCLIQTASDAITILEVKTGQPREEHRAQLGLYEQAAKRLFPSSSVDTRLVYASIPKTA